MKVIVPGHLYELENFENKEAPGQKLQFIHKEKIEEGSPILTTLSDGTTNEEVLAVLLDRLNSMQAKFPCRENQVAVTHIETALLWLNHRTASRKARGVEGKHLA